MQHDDGWKSKLTQIPLTIWVLGIVSLLMNISSVMITILTPIFITTVLGVSVISAATIDGFAEALSSFLKVCSGTISDKLKKRKLLIVIGYGAGILIKPLFAMAQSVSWIVTARMIDRLSNGIRDTPRDALMADVSPAHIKGKCFGLRMTMASAGSLIGAIITFLLMWLWLMDFRTVFWLSLIPSTLALILLIFFIKDKHVTPDIKISKQPEFHLREIKALPKSFWYLLLIVFVFMMGKTSESMLVLRTFQIIQTDASLGSWLITSPEKMGENVGLVCCVMIVMNLVYSASAYPIGRISDRFDRRIFLFLGGFVLIAANLLLAFSTTTLTVTFGIMLWGLHMGIVQGLFASMIVERSPAHLKGTAFGAFHMVSGFSAIIGIPTSGYIWQTYGAEYSFIAEVIVVAIAMCLAIFLPKYKEKSANVS